ncbi:hypothetical protein DVA86_04095 [Streptomyces armeniacus]|uniref:HEAT repeat domain-containing protein n=1 Tax=Streptomyces armeniacus TaxID=83291 RepID=A0A345XJY3_9ACTN|nr:hypothetical protein [Streptomyces armeniacus]AXK31949.1 hypothetical protein DVA86_04095 [Streptomyces armeniacus]
MAHNEHPQAPQPEPQPSGRRPLTAPPPGPAGPLTPDQLCARFGPLPFPDRTRALARHARSLGPDAYAALRTALDAGDPDDRRTGLLLAVARRDLDAVHAALDDPLLRRRALAAAIRLPVSETALSRLASGGTREVRHETFRVLRLSRRTCLAARLLPRVHARHGPAEASRLLPACTPAVAAAWLPRTGAPDGVLRSLARTAPAAVAERLAAEYTAAAAAPYRFTRRHRLLAAVIAERDTDAGLLLLDRAPALLDGRGGTALLRRPGAVLAVLRRQGPAGRGGARALAGAGTAGGGTLNITTERLPRAVLRALRALPPDELAELAGRCRVPYRPFAADGRLDNRPHPLLALLPPAERRRLVEPHLARRGPARGSLRAFAALSAADRGELVRPYLRDRPYASPVRLGQAATAPLADAEELLRTGTGSHRTHERACSWQALLACAQLNAVPEEYARVLGSCERAWHDRDEVRAATLRQAAAARPALLGAVPEQVLREAVAATVQYGDSRGGTLGAAALWLRRTAEHAAEGGAFERAARTALLLCRVVDDPRWRGPVHPLRLTPSAAAGLWAAVPGEQAVRPRVFVPLAGLLARRLDALPALDTLLGGAVRGAHGPEWAARAVPSWLRPAAHREARCAELLATGLALGDGVALRTVATRRTDLLDTVLDAVLDASEDAVPTSVRGGGVEGAPLSDASRGLLRLPPSVTGRWRPDQRDRWQRWLARTAADEDTELRTRADAALRLRTPDALVRLAREAPLPVATAALTALGETGEGALAGDGGAEARLRELLGHTGSGGARGRAALAAVRSVAARLPDSTALAVLGAAARDTNASVGSRKEAARALGELTGEAALRELCAAWDAPGQHGDVRAALARQLVSRIARPGVAERLTAGIAEPAIRTAVVPRAALTVPFEARAAYGDFLTGLIRTADDASAEAACTALPGWVPPGASDALDAVTEVMSGTERPLTVWRAAVRQFGVLAGDAGRETLRDTLRRLRERACPYGAADTAAGARTERDADAVRRLADLAAEIVHNGRGSPAQQAADRAAVVEALLAAGLRGRAAETALGSAYRTLRNGVADTGGWQRAMELAAGRVERLSDARTFTLDGGDPDVESAARQVVAALRASAAPAAGLTALALVRSVAVRSPHQAWWHGQLDALRAHPDPDTAEAALLTVLR